MIWKFAVIFLIISIPSVYFLLHQKQIALVKPVSESIFLASTPSIDQIFGDNHTWVATFSAEKVRTVIATGDIIPARSVNYQTQQRHDFKWPYLKTADVIRNADLTAINLETPLIGKCLLAQEGMVFCGDAKNVEGLVYAGVDIASLANNHAADYGIWGVQETVNLLNKNNISVTGVDGPIIKDVRGIKFAFLGYDDIARRPGVSNVDEEKIKSEIAEAQVKATVVIVMYHWGVEYRDQPDNRQKYLGHLAVDSGADLVIGNHPHWIQPIEIYKDKLITYAHGNFVFDQMWSQKTREGVIGRYTFYGDKLIDVEYFPIQINDFGQPFLLSDPQKTTILENMRTASIKLSCSL